MGQTPNGSSTLRPAPPFTLVCKTSIKFFAFLIVIRVIVLFFNSIIMSEGKYYVVFYTHCDEGWGYYWGPSLKHIRMANSLVVFSALNLMRNCKEFKWVLDNFNTLMKFWSDFPELREALRKATLEGRLEITGGLLIVPAFNIEGESLIRNFMLGRKFFEKMGLKVNKEVLLAADVTCHHAQLPQIFSKVGIKYYKLCRPVGDYVLSKKEIPIDFIWEGLDGSRIVCNRVFYGEMWIDLKNFLSKKPYEEGFEEALKLLEKRIREFYSGEIRDKYLVFIGADWQIFHPALCDFIEYWRSKGYDVRIVTLSEYFKEIDTSKLKIIKGSIDPVGWAAVYGVAGDLSRYRVLKTVNRVLNSEKASSLAFILGKNYPERFYEKAWFYIILNWHHDAAYAYLSDVDFKDQEHILRSIYLSATKLMHNALHYIASKIDTHNIRGQAIVVFNTLPWERIDYVTIKVKVSKDELKKLKILDSEGNEVIFQVLRRKRLDGSLYEVLLKFLAKVPPLGYSVYQLVFEKSEIKRKYHYLENVVENEYVKIRVKGGCIESLYYKPSRTELLSTKMYLGNDIVMEKVDFGPDGLTIENKYGEYKSSDFEFKGGLIQDGNLFTILKYNGSIFSARIGRMILVHHLKPIIEFITTIEDSEEGHRFRAVFPFNFNGKLIRSIPFGIEEFNPNLEIYLGGERSYGLLPGVFWASEWIDYSCENYGVTLSNRWRIGYQIVRNEISLPLVSTVQKSVLGRFAYPHLLGLGKFTFRYIIVPHVGTLSESKSYRVVMEWLNPLIGIFTSRHFGKLPLRGSLISLESKSGTTLLSSLFVHKKSLYMRLYEYEGKEDTARIKFMGDYIKISESDLLCKKVIKSEIEELRFKPFEIKTIKLL